MAEYLPEGKSSKWSLLAAYNPDSTELNKVEEVYMEDSIKGLLVANYVWDYDGLEWVKATQTTLSTDILYLALDDVETILGTIDADTGAIKDAVEIMDDWDESNRAKVNLIAGQAGVAGGTGVRAANVQRVTVCTDDDVPVTISSILPASVLSTVNSTDVELNANSSWTGASEEVIGYSGIGVVVYADQASAASGYEMQVSYDGNAWITKFSSTITASQLHYISMPVAARYFRIKYTNGGTNQGTFILQTIYHITAPSPQIGRADDAIEDDTSVGYVKEYSAADALTALQIMDDWDESDRAKVNLIVGQAGIAAGAGASGVTVPRVTLASDDPGVASLATIDTSLDSAVALLGTIDTDTGNIKTNTDDIVTALQVMDDWDLNDRCRVSPISGQDGVAGNAGAVGATVQRVTLASDDPAVADLAALEVLQTDNRQHFFLGGWLVDGDNVYVGKEDKGGNYIIAKHATDTGVVTYEGGSGGLPASAGWAAMSYQDYATEF